MFEECKNISFKVAYEVKRIYIYQRNIVLLLGSVYFLIRKLPNFDCNFLRESK